MHIILFLFKASDPLAFFLELGVFGNRAIIGIFLSNALSINFSSLSIECNHIDFPPDSRHNERPIQTITVVLLAFKDHDGMQTLNRMLEIFTSEIRKASVPIKEFHEKKPEEFILYELATAGTSTILSLYSQIVNGRNLTEAQQTMALQGRAERRPDPADVFSPAQLLVDLRMAILPIIRNLWGSDLIEKGTSQISENLFQRQWYPA